MLYINYKPISQGSWDVLVNDKLVGTIRDAEFMPVASLKAYTNALGLIQLFISEKSKKRTLARRR